MFLLEHSPPIINVPGLDDLNVKCVVLSLVGVVIPVIISSWGVLVSTSNADIDNGSLTLPASSINSIVQSAY